MIRRVGKKLLFAMVVALGALAGVAKADSIQIASYLDTPTPYQWHFDNAAGTLSASTTGLFSAFGPPNQIINFNGSVLTTVSATVNGNASTDGSNVTSQALDGHISFVDPVTLKLVLRVDFVGALISGVNGSRADSLGADELKGQVVAYQTNNAFRVGSFNFPSSFIIGLSLEQLTGLTITNNNLSTFDATATGSFMTGPSSGDTPGTPSPESIWGGLSLMGMIGGTSMWVRRRGSHRNV
jgi:hypothetical protein